MSAGASSNIGSPFCRGPDVAEKLTPGVPVVSPRSTIEIAGLAEGRCDVELVVVDADGRASKPALLTIDVVAR